MNLQPHRFFIWLVIVLAWIYHFIGGVQAKEVMSQLETNTAWSGESLPVETHLLHVILKKNERVIESEPFDTVCVFVLEGEIEVNSIFDEIGIFKRDEAFCSLSHSAYAIKANKYSELKLIVIKK